MSKKNEVTSGLTKTDISYLLNVYSKAKELCKMIEDVLLKVSDKKINELIENKNGEVE